MLTPGVQARTVRGSSDCARGRSTEFLGTLCSLLVDRLHRNAAETQWKLETHGRPCIVCFASIALARPRLVVTSVPDRDGERRARPSASRTCCRSPAAARAYASTSCLPTPFLAPAAAETLRLETNLNLVCTLRLPERERERQHTTQRSFKTLQPMSHGLCSIEE